MYNRKRQQQRGWNFKAMRAYEAGRFNDVVHTGNPVFNHKVEQVVRAVGCAEGFSVLNLDCKNVALADGVSFDLNTLHNIGVLRGKRTQLHPEAVTALAILGIHSGMFLWYLGTCRIVDDLNPDVNLEVIVNDGEYIYAPLNVLIQVARDVVFNKDKLLALYAESKRG